MDSNPRCLSRMTNILTIDLINCHCNQRHNNHSHQTNYLHHQSPHNNHDHISSATITTATITTSTNWLKSFVAKEWTSFWYTLSLFHFVCKSNFFHEFLTGEGKQRGHNNSGNKLQQNLAKNNPNFVLKNGQFRPHFSLLFPVTFDYHHFVQFFVFWIPL